MERREKVDTFLVDYECPECKVGWMRPTGQVYLTNPTQHPHLCTECNHPMTFVGKSYPYTETKKAE